MDGDTSGIDGSDSGGCDYDHSFGAFLPESAEEGGFAGAGFAGEEDADACVLYKFPGEFQFVVVFHR